MACPSSLASTPIHLMIYKIAIHVTIALMTILPLEFHASLMTITIDRAATYQAPLSALHSSCITIKPWAIQTRQATGQQ